MFDLLLTFYPGIYDSSSWTRLTRRRSRSSSTSAPRKRWCASLGNTTAWPASRHFPQKQSSRPPPLPVRMMSHMREAPSFRAAEDRRGRLVGGRRSAGGWWQA